MKLSQVVSLAPAIYKSGTSTVLEGAPGSGKTDTVENEVPDAICTALGIDRDNFSVNTEMLTQMEAPDLGGFRIPTEDEQGRAITAVTMPDIICDMKTEFGILFLDEIGQAGPDTQKAAATALHAHKLGKFDIPPGWVVWGATNRMEDKAGRHKTMSHVQNRILTIRIDQDADGWCGWASTMGMHPLWIAAAKFFSSEVFTDKVPSEPAPFSTARSYTKWHDLLMEYTNGNMTEAISEDAVAMELGRGLVGMTVAAKVLGFMKIASVMPTYDDLVADPVKVFKGLPAGRPDVMLAVASMVIHNLQLKHIKAALQILDLIPNEFKVSTVQQLLKKYPTQLVQTADFAPWAAKNRTLINAVMSL